MRVRSLSTTVRELLAAAVAAVAVVAPAGLGCSRTKMMGRRRMRVYGLNSRRPTSQLACREGKGEARKQQ